MASSDTEICNMALSAMKAKVITSLAEQTANAELCRTYFQQSVDYVLTQHPWNCSTTRQTLAQIGGYVNPDPDGLQKAYQLPVDPYCLRVFAMFPDEEYVIEGRRLLTDQDTCGIRYAFRVNDYPSLSPHVTALVASYLAYMLAYPLTQNKDYMTVRYELYKDCLKEARTLDSQEGSVRTADIDVLVVTRRQAAFEDFERNRNSV